MNYHRQPEKENHHDNHHTIPQLGESIALLAEQTGTTQEQVIAAALEQFALNLRPIPELSPQDEAMLCDIESKTNYTTTEFYQRWNNEIFRQPEA